MLPFSRDSKYLQKQYEEKKKVLMPKKAKKVETNKEEVFNVEVVPKEMNIFLNTEKHFLPEDKDFDDLTEKESKHLKNQYRFSPFRPGFYQGITGWVPEGSH